MQSIVTYTNNKQGKNNSQGFSFIWAQTYLVPAQIIAKIKKLYFTPINAEGSI